MDIWAQMKTNDYLDRIEELLTEAITLKSNHNTGLWTSLTADVSPGVFTPWSLIHSFPVYKACETPQMTSVTLKWVTAQEKSEKETYDALSFSVSKYWQSENRCCVRQTKAQSSLLNCICIWVGGLWLWMRVRGPAACACFCEVFLFFHWKIVSVYLCELAHAQANLYVRFFLCMRRTSMHMCGGRDRAPNSEPGTYTCLRWDTQGFIFPQIFLPKLFTDYLYTTSSSFEALTPNLSSQISSVSHLQPEEVAVFSHLL